MDDDRLLSSIDAQRPLEDGCEWCSFSKVYCRAVLYLDRKTCCPHCSHTAT